MAYKQRWLEYFDVLDGDNSGFIDAGDLKYYTKVIIFLFFLYWFLWTLNIW